MGEKKNKTFLKILSNFFPSYHSQTFWKTCQILLSSLSQPPFTPQLLKYGFRANYNFQEIQSTEGHIKTQHRNTISKIQTVARSTEQMAQFSNYSHK